MRWSLSTLVVVVAAVVVLVLVLRQRFWAAQIATEFVVAAVVVLEIVEVMF